MRILLRMVHVVILQRQLRHGSEDAHARLRRRHRRIRLPGTADGGGIVHCQVVRVVVHVGILGRMQRHLRRRRQEPLEGLPERRHRRRRLPGQRGRDRPMRAHARLSSEILLGAMELLLEIMRRRKENQTEDLHRRTNQRRVRRTSSSRRSLQRTCLPEMVHVDDVDRVLGLVRRRQPQQAEGVPERRSWRQRLPRKHHRDGSLQRAGVRGVVDVEHLDAVQRDLRQRVRAVQERLQRGSGRRYWLRGKQGRVQRMWKHYVTVPDVEPMEQMDGLHCHVRRRIENEG